MLPFDAMLPLKTLSGYGEGRRVELGGCEKRPDGCWIQVAAPRQRAAPDFDAYSSRRSGTGLLGH